MYDKKKTYCKSSKKYIVLLILQKFSSTKEIMGCNWCKNNDKEFSSFLKWDRDYQR